MCVRRALGRKTGWRLLTCRPTWVWRARGQEGLDRQVKQGAGGLAPPGARRRRLRAPISLETGRRHSSGLESGSRSWKRSRRALGVQRSAQNQCGQGPRVVRQLWGAGRLCGLRCRHCAVHVGRPATESGCGVAAAGPDGCPGGGASVQLPQGRAQRGWLAHESAGMCTAKSLPAALEQKACPRRWSRTEKPWHGESGDSLVGARLVGASGVRLGREKRHPKHRNASRAALQHWGAASKQGVACASVLACGRAWCREW